MRHFAVLAVLILIAAIASGCGHPAPTPRSHPVKPDTAEVFDVSKCQPGFYTHYEPMGSTSFRVLGVGSNQALCRVDLGREVENPQGVGKTDQHCLVPRSQGRVKIGDLDHYCQAPH